MTITNGYCTLAEFKERKDAAYTYTAATLTFSAAAKTITDSAHRLKRFQDGQILQISGSTANNGVFTVTVGNDPTTLTVAEALVNEAAGQSVTITDISNPANDAAMESVIEAVSRSIDNECARRFYVNSVDEVRYYSTPRVMDVWVNDLVSVTSLETDNDLDGTFETLWSAADYLLWPYNAALDGQPYSKLELAPAPSTSSGSGFPTSARGVKVTGKFGWPSVPKGIKDACLLWAIRLYMRKDAAFGILGNETIGFVRIPGVDPDVRLMFRPYMRRV